MDYNFSKGQKLVVELTSTEVLEGDYYSGSKHRIELINILVYPDQHRIKGPYSYYRQEISSVHVLNENEPNIVDAGVIKDTTKNCLVNGDLSTKVINLDQAEYERLKSLSQNYVYMNSMDHRYYEATDHINNCENIGVLGVTTTAGKMSTLSLLVTATWDQVYVFDIISFNQKKFPAELKSAFESELIKKTVHDSRQLVDLMYTCYKIKIVNIFDTQVADIMVRKHRMDGALPEQIKNLSECLIYYFNFPNALLYKAQTTKLKKWEERPLSALRKYRAAQMATYLITLKNNLETILLQDFYKTVDVYSKSLISCTVIESHRNLLSTKLSDLAISALKSLDNNESCSKKNPLCNGIRNTENGTLK